MIKKVSKQLMKISKSELYLIIMGILLSVFYIMAYDHFDCDAITQWGHDLLVCIGNGRISDYPQYTYDVFTVPTNYSLLVNANTAFWLSPIYMMEQIQNKTFDIVIYQKWYKLCIVLFYFIAVKLFAKILRKMNYSDSQISIGCGLFLTSAIALLATVAKGQVDVFALIFGFLGVLALLDKKYIQMSLCFGIALLFKPLVILVTVPIMVLLVGKERAKGIVNFIVMIIPYLLVKGITVVLMPQYKELSSQTLRILMDALGADSVVDQMFQVQVNGVLIFGLVGGTIGFLCYYLAIHNRVERWNYLVFPSLMMMFFGMLVFASFQWFIYILPALIIMGIEFEKKSDMLLLNAGVNFGLVLYFSAAESMFWIPCYKMLFQEKIVKYGVQYMGVYQPYVIKLGKTVFYICMLLICGVFVYEKQRKKEPLDNQEKTSQMLTYEKILLVVQPVPALLYVLYTLMQG